MYKDPSSAIAYTWMQGIALPDPTPAILLWDDAVNLLPLQVLATANELYAWNMQQQSMVKEKRSATMSRRKYRVLKALRKLHNEAQGVRPRLQEAHKVMCKHCRRRELPEVPWWGRIRALLRNGKHGHPLLAPNGQLGRW